MLPQTLTIICANVGLGCLAYTYYLLHSFKDRVDKQTSDAMSHHLLEEGVGEFVQSVRKKEVTFKMVHDFYMEFVEVNEPSRRLRRAWRNLVFAALAFILTAILGNLDFPSFTDIISFTAYYSLTFAIAFLILGFNDVYNIGKKIV